MRTWVHQGVRGLGLSAALVLLALSAPADGSYLAGDKIQIGVPGSLFRDVPASMIPQVTHPFNLLMREQTGLSGNLVVVPDPVDLARQLAQDKLHLAVFHGFEFAWAQEKHPELKPLCIAINSHRELHAYLVVRNDSKCSGLADLKGQALSVPQGTRGHCHLYLERCCAQQGSAPDLFFGKIVNHPNAGVALEDVLRGKVQAALVDGVTLEGYQTLKPGNYARLKVLQRSETFPASVIAYKEGNLNPSLLAQFRDGMINAHRSDRSRVMMMLWRLTAFESVPGNYTQLVQNINRVYPAPGSQTASSSVAPSAAP